MATDKDNFIANLVSKHSATRPLPLPRTRALSWFLAAIMGCAVLMWWRQSFRPGFVQQLVEHPRLLVEIVAALLCVTWGAHVTFVATTPGKRLSVAAQVLGALSVSVLVVTLVLSIVVPSPASAMVGKRHLCSLEVIVFGGAAMGWMLFMARKGYLRYSSSAAALVGLAAGLIPAAIMQVACMYDPWHALQHHYAPILVLVPIGAWLVKGLERK